MTDKPSRCHLFPQKKKTRWYDVERFGVRDAKTGKVRKRTKSKALYQWLRSQAKEKEREKLQCMEKVTWT